MPKNRKLITVLIGYLVLFLLLAGAVYYRSITKGAAYKTIADFQYEYRVRAGEINFKLVDDDENDLMSYKDKYFVDIVPPDFLLNDTSSYDFSTLAIILKNYDSKYDLFSMIDEKKEKPLSIEIDENTYKKITKLKSIKGVYSYVFKAVDNEKSWSIENMILSDIKSNKDEKKIFNNIRSNKYDEYVFSKDVNGNVLVENENINSSHAIIRLTINKVLQNNIKAILNNEENKKYAQIGVCMIDDAGKVKALVQKDDSLPNINTSVLLYPGSIFKTIAEEAALEERKINISDKFTCNGMNEGKGHSLHGSLNVSDAYTVSCNDIFSQIGNKVGSDALIKLAEKQGMLKRALDLQQEVTGKFDRNPEIKDGSLGLTAIGQNIRITPVEALSIPSVVINGGKYVKPSIIDHMNEDVTTVISKDTADILKNQMINVVKSGTAKLAYQNNIEIGGKTGTTERTGDAPGDILGDVKKNTLHSDGWFAGFFKACDKYYSMVVVVQDIDPNTQSGGNTAAAIFKQIAEKYVDDLKNK